MAVPYLSFTCDLPAYVQTLPENILHDLQHFHGLVLLKEYAREVYPFLPYFFFDSGSADLPDRYILFTEPAQTMNFDESKIPGGTMQKYYHLLNIIGARLRAYPKATISITGCNSQQPVPGETRALSRRRAERVRDYLIHIWGIAPQRLRLAARDLPRSPSSPKSALSQAENRRVEFSSRDEGITGPVVQEEVRAFPLQETVRFDMRNGVADSTVVSRRIEIRRHGELWTVLSDSLIGLTALQSPAYVWMKEGSEDPMPTDDAPFIAQLVVQTRGGVELRSAEVTIAVRTVYECGIVHCSGPRESERYSIALFEPGQSKLTQLHTDATRRILEQWLPDSSRIEITGYAVDELSDADERELSRKRAAEVLKVVRKYAPPEKVLSIQSKGDGGALYLQDLPEGRCFNRTVQIYVMSRHKYWWESW